MVRRKMKWSGIYIAEEGGVFFFGGKRDAELPIYAMNGVKRIVVVGPSRRKWNLLLYPTTCLDLVIALDLSDFQC